MKGTFNKMASNCKTSGNGNLNLQDSHSHCNYTNSKSNNDSHEEVFVDNKTLYYTDNSVPLTFSYIHPSNKDEQVYILFPTLSPFACNSRGFLTAWCTLYILSAVESTKIVFLLLFLFLLIIPDSSYLSTTVDPPSLSELALPQLIPLIVMTSSSTIIPSSSSSSFKNSFDSWDEVNCSQLLPPSLIQSITY
jgi:hypothetical protein